MGFKDIVFLASRARFSTTFINNCGGGESLWTTTCLRNVVGVSNSILPVKYFCSNDASFLSFECNHRTATKMRLNMATLSFGNTTWI